MTYEEFRILANNSHRKRIQKILHNPDFNPLHADDLTMKIAHEQCTHWGFNCAYAAIEEALSSSREISLFWWSKQVFTIKGSTFEVTCRPCSLDSRSVHFQFRHLDGHPLPFTETGYRSAFVPVHSFHDKQPADYVESLFANHTPKNQQLSLF